MKKMNWIKKGISALLALNMVLSIVPLPAFATDEDKLCEHHTEHTADCGYVTAVAGSDCTHVCEEDCADACVHTHDASCGYAEAVEGQPCGYVCQECAAGEEAVSPSCTCQTLCAEGSVNGECAVCAADLSGCAGTEAAAAATRVIYMYQYGLHIGTYCDFFDADGNELTVAYEYLGDELVRYTIPAEAKYYELTEDGVGGGGGSGGDVSDYPELPANADTYDHSTYTWSCSHPGYGEGKCTLCGEPCPGHTGGTATCKEQAVCDTGGASYGEWLPHDFNDSGVCTVCNEKGYTYDAATNTYTVYTAGGLYYVAELVFSDDNSINITLAADIVLNENLADKVTVTEDGALSVDDSVRIWRPIGALGMGEYYGTFDGGNHTITGLYSVPDSNGIGLIATLAQGATVKNVKIHDFCLKNGGGAVATTNYGKIIDCSISGTGIFGGRGSVTVYAGGIVSFNEGAVENCSSSADLYFKGTGEVGGIVGYAYSGSSVTGCYSSGTLEAEVVNGLQVGGIVGNASGSITDCHNSSVVKVRNTASDIAVSVDVGGIAGMSCGDLTGCYNSGSVEVVHNSTGSRAQIYVGGIAGQLNDCSVTGCYNTGSLKAENRSGNASMMSACGIGFSNYSTVTGCYNTGSVESGKSSAAIRRGGGDVTDCYYLSDCVKSGESNDSEIEGITAKTAEQFASGEVAYALNGDQTAVTYKQTLGTDAAPNFTGGTVYQVTGCDGSAAYSNTNENIGHNWMDGTCTGCGDVCDHSESEHTTATNNGNGTHSFTCTVCGDVTEDHSFDENGTCICGINLFTVSGSTLTIDGTLGDKTEATEEDITVLVNKIKECLDQGITTITVTGSEPAMIDMGSWTNTAIGEAIYRLRDDESYHGKIDLILQDVTQIVDQEFDSAHALNSINLPKVTTIGNGAFYDCQYLEELTFGSVVTVINHNDRAEFHRVGEKVEGCDLVLNCGQLQAATEYPPNLNTKTWWKDNEWKSITLTHALTYSASGNILSEMCTSGCGHQATATVTAENATYNGTAQETASVSYSEGWMGGEVSVSYENNIKAGTATAQITRGEVTASTTFTVAPKELTLSLTSNGKEYDGTNVLTSYEAKVEGFLFYDEGSYESDTLDYDDVYDDVRVDADALTVTLPGSTAGEYTTATVTGITLVGEDAANYTIASELENVPLAGKYGTFSISPLRLYITPEDQSLTEGEEISQTAYTLYKELPAGHTLSGVVLVESEDGKSVSANVESAKIFLGDVDVTDCFELSSYETGNITRTHEGHSFNENGFCATGECDNYQSAVVETVTDEYGNESECYLIYNAGQLYWFAQQVNEYGYNSINGKLMADITVNADLTADNLRHWTPIGSSYPTYNGHFDGNGKTISGLYVKSEGSYVGLFGCTDYAYQIKNIHITNSYFEGNSDVGALIGYAGTYISGCTVSDSVTVVGNSSVGGIVGSSAYGELTNCWSAANVTEEGEPGAGLVGDNHLTINNCYTTASKPVGYNNGEITNSYYLSATETGDGGKTAEQFKSGEVAYLLQSGVTIYDEELGDYTTVGAPHIWGQTVGTESYPVFGGKKVYQVANTGCPAYGEYGYSNDENGTYAADHSFPEGSNGFCACGEGYEPAVLNGDVYEISNAGQLYWFAAKVNGGENGIDGKLVDNITVNKNVLQADGTLNEGEFREWTPIGTSSNKYNGIFDGNGKTVSGLYFNDDSTDYLGLFGNTNNDAEVQNLGVIDSYIAGGRYVGGVVGNNSGTVKDCYNTGTVSGTGFYVGGVVSSNGIGTVESCYNTGIVSGSDYYIGGVVGYSGETLKDCYNTGTVSGGVNNIGGVVGCIKGTIESCYNTGTVSSIDGGTVGGVAGFHGGIAKDCYNTGTVSGFKNIGGVVGYIGSDGTITSSYNSGNVSGDTSVGGVVGVGSLNGTVTSSYNTGEVTGTGSNVGGVAGRVVNTFTITSSYNIGTVSGGSYYVGGVVGEGVNATIESCYYLSGCAKDGNQIVQNGVGASTIGSVSADVEGSTAAKTKAQFTKGEVAYLLGAPFGQNLDNGGTVQSSPVLSDALVYEVINCDGNMKYSNTYSSERPEHNWENNACTGCNTPGGYCGDPNVNDGKNLLWTVTGGKLTITGSGAMANYDGVSTAPWHDVRNSITSATIGEGVTTIGSYAFDSLKYLPKVSIPGTVTTIGAFAFINTGLTAVDIPAGVTTIGDSAFEHCTALETVTISNTVTFIGRFAFDGCTALKTVNVPCTWNEKLLYTFANTVTVNIAKHTGGTATCEAAAVCTACGASYGEKDPKNHTYTSNVCCGYCGVTDVLGYSRMRWALTESELSITGTGDMAEYTVGSRPWAAHAANITSVSIGDTVPHIGKYAFNGFTKLTEINIPASVRLIDEAAFANCSALTKVTIPNSVVVIESAAFRYCTALTEVTIPDSVTTIGSAAFGECTALKEVTIPASVTQMGGGVFDGCDALETANVPCSWAVNPLYTFANTVTVNIADHSYENGFCFCGAYEPAVLKDGVYQISNAGQLYWFAAVVNGGYGEVAQNKTANAMLTDNITVNTGVLNADGTLNGDGSNLRKWTPIGKNRENIYGGTFDGNGKTVSGLYFNDSTAGYVGLFGCAAFSLKNVGVLDSYICGKDEVGSVCGYSTAFISGCYSKATVSGNSYVGGVVGSYEAQVTSNCYHIGTVSGNRYVGGVAGYVIWTGGPNSCYHIGTVSGSSHVGGVVGYIKSGRPPVDCYYLDTTVTGGIDGADAEGQAEAKTAAQFASGEVAYLLQGESETLVWGQTVGTNDHPVLGGDKVYKVLSCDGESDAYSNTDANKTHTYENGKCSVCGAYDLWVAGEQISDSKLTVSGITGTATYDPATDTLTLIGFDNNFKSYSFTDKNENLINAAVYSVSDLKVVLEGENYLYADGDGFKMGIQTEAALTIGGDGTLEGGGIYSAGGTTINSGTVNIYGVDVAFDGPSTTINGGSVNVSVYTTVTYHGTLTVNGGRVVLEGGGSGDGYGVGSLGTIVIGDGMKVYDENGDLIENPDFKNLTYALIQAPCDHTQATPSYTWSDDPITLTVSVSCTACGETFAGSTTDMDVTTSDDGFTTTYTATVTLDGRDYTDSKVVSNEVTSVNITWGDMSFTYTDESGWNNPDTAWVQVTNTGNTGVTVTYTYETERTDITGSFDDGTNPVTAPVAIDAENAKKIWLRLDGRPGEALDGTIVGIVKLTIE